jgi:hypothetical protein
VSDFPARVEKKTHAGDKRSPTAGGESTSNQVIGSIEDLDKQATAGLLQEANDQGRGFQGLSGNRIGRKGLRTQPPIRVKLRGIGMRNTSVQRTPFEGVVKLIRSAPKGASCGVDNFPIDILKQLTKTVIKKEFPTDTRLFLDLLLGFFNIVFTHGQCPPGVLSFYDAGEAIRLRQGAIKVRLIGKATTYRKIVDVAQQLPHRQDLQTAFGDIQYCGASFGTERMQNSMNIHLSNHPDLTYSASDYSDAYCHANRSKILSGVARVMPEIVSFTQRRLEAVQDVIYYGSEAGPVSIKQAVGLTQGQATSGQLYSLGIHPLNEELSALAHQHVSGILSAYIDDVKAHSAAELIADIIATQQSKGPDFGAKLNMTKHRILLESCLDDNRAVLLHATFMIHSRSRLTGSTSTRTTSRIPLKKRVLNCTMETSYSGSRRLLVLKQVEEISAEWRLASHRLKDEPHHLWYLLKHILASKFTYLFRGIPPGFAQPLADCLTNLYRETCEILAQCETIPDISFDLARIREGAGLGYADDLLDSAFAASKIASLRSIEQVNPGYLASVKAVFEAGTAACHDLAFPLPARQLASSLLAIDPTFLQDDHQGQDYSGLRKLQSAFLAPQKVARTVVVEEQQCPEHHLSEWEEP